MYITTYYILPLEEGMCGSEDSVNDMEISTLEAGHHLC